MSYNTTSPTDTKSKNILKNTLGSSVSASKLTNFGEESSSPISPYKSRYISGSASKGSFLSSGSQAFPYNKEGLETEIKDHIHALKKMRTELGKQKSFLLSQMDSTPKTETTSPRSYIKYADKKSLTPAHLSSSTLITPLDKSESLRKGAEVAYRGNYSLKNSTSNLERTKVESPTKARGSDSVYNRLIGSMTPENLAKERAAYNLSKPYASGSLQKLQASADLKELRGNFVQDTGSFSQIAQKSLGNEPVNVHRSYDFAWKKIPKMETINISSLVQNQAQNEGAKSTSTNRLSEPIKNNQPNSAVGRSSTGVELSPRFDLLQKEISGRYQRTKDMLDNVFTKNNVKAQKSGGSPYYERTGGIRSSQDLSRRVETEEQPRTMSFKTLEAEGLHEMSFQRRDYQDQPKKRGATRYVETEEDVSLMKEQEENRIKEYQKIIEELQQRINGLEKERQQEREDKEEGVIVIERAGANEEEKVKKRSVMRQDDDELVEKVQEMAKRIDGLEKENEELKANLNSNENKERVSQQGVESDEQKKELEEKIRTLEKENSHFKQTVHKLEGDLEALMKVQHTSNLQESEVTQKYLDLEKEFKNVQKQLESWKEKDKANQQVTEKLGEQDKSLQENKTKIQGLNKKIEELVATQNSLESQVKELNQAKTLISEVGGKSTGGFVAQLERLIKQYNASQSAVEQEKEKSNSLKMKNIEEEHLLAEKVREIEGVLAEKERFIQSLQARLEETESELRGNAKEYTDKIKQLENYKSSLLGQIHTINASNEKLEGEVTQLSQREEEVASQNQRIKELEEELVKVQKEGEQKIEDLRGEKKSMVGEIQQRDQRIEEIEKQVYSLKEEREQLLANQSKFEHEKKQSETVIKELRETLSELEKKVGEKDVDERNRLEEVKKEKGVVESELKTALAEKDKLAGELRALETREEDYKKQVLTEREHQEKVREEAIGEYKKIVEKLNEEKQELEKKVKENSKDAKKGQKETEGKVKELEAAKETVEKKSQALQKELEEGRLRIEQLESKDREREQSFGADLEKLQQEKKELEKELNGLKNKESQNQGELGKRIEELEANLKATQEKNEKLQQENESQRKNLQGQIEALEKENKQAKSANQGEADKKEKLIKELEKKVQGAVKERDEQIRKVEEMKQEVNSKEEQVKGLKFDVNQMKNFILKKQVVNLMEKDIGEEQKSEIASEFPLPTSEISFNQDVSVKEGSDWGDDISKKSSPNVPDQRKNKKRGGKMEGTTEIIIDAPHGYRQEKIKSKKQIENDPLHVRYEGIIKDLTDKLAESKAKFKKEVEIQVFETSKHHVEREQELMDEIEDLRKEREKLQKKIEDIEWDKAYEHTERTKLETQSSKVLAEKVEEVKQGGNGDADGKKKKKKKKKAKTQEKKDEGDSD